MWLQLRFRFQWETTARLCSHLRSFPSLLYVDVVRSGRLAAVLAPVLGLLATRITIWLASACAICGSISMSTTVQLEPAVYGAMGSFCSPILYSVVILYIRPSTFDWREFLRVESLVGDDRDSSPLPQAPTSR